MLFATIFPALTALIGAFLGTFLTHRLYVKRWERERVEAYKAEVFKVKFEVYRELVAAYVEFSFKLPEYVYHNVLTDELFNAHLVDVEKIIQKNAFIISQTVKGIALHNFVKEMSIETDFKKRSKILGAQNQALANTCRAELGIEAISDDIEKTFSVVKPVDKLNGEYVKNNSEDKT